MIIKKKTFFLTAFLLVCSLVVYSTIYFDAAVAKEVVTALLKPGTPIVLKLVEPVNPNTKMQGETVLLEVVRDIKVNRKIVVATGAIAEGTVTISRKAGMIGKPQEIGFSLNYVQAVDGTQAMLRGNFMRQGEDKQSTFLLIGIILCPITLFFQGGKSEFNAGEELRGYIAAQHEISLEE